MNRKSRTCITSIIAICIVFGLIISFTNLESLHKHSSSYQNESPFINSNKNQDYDQIKETFPKNIFIYLKNINTTTECIIEYLLREPQNYNIYLYLDPTIQEKPKSISTFTSSYNNFFYKENKFDFENFLKTNFTKHSKLTKNFLNHLKKILFEEQQHIDKQLVPLLDLWLNGGYYFSVNISLDLLKSTEEFNELYNFYCENTLLSTHGHSEKHKICKINFLKTNSFDCIVELAIKNYLLYYEKHKTYNFHSMFMNLYAHQHKILNKKYKISQNQYSTCFKSKLKHLGRHINSLEDLFRFSNDSLNYLIKINEETCPLINSVKNIF